MRMALEERDMKILGRPMKYVTRDGATQAGTSTRRAEEAIDGEGARFMIGPWSSGVALAVSEVAKRKKVLHLFSGGTEDISGLALPPLFVPVGGEPLHRGEDRGGRLHEGQPEGEALAPAGRRLRLRLVGGELHQGSRQAARHRLRRRGPPSAGRARIPNYVQKAAANRPDVVVMINFGGDAVAGAREIFNFGLTPKVPLIMSWSSGVEELIQLSPEIRENLWVGTNFYYTADTPVAKKFVATYRRS